MGEKNRDPEKQASLCWVLVGPTASGKTEVALELAGRHGLEIVSIDSMQIYRGMDIGTAKPTADERRRVPHHLIDGLDPEETCNVARFREMALEAIAGVWSRGRRPLLVGGSAMYLKGVVWGLMEAPGRAPGLRERLRQEYEQLGAERLHRRLGRIDPEAAERIHPNDVQRLVRALEVCELTGRPVSDRQEQFAGEPEVAHSMVGLSRPREELYRRIDERVDRMMAAGLLEEVRSLRGRLGPQSSQAVGYKELISHLEGERGLDEAVQLIKSNTRRYAKHQLTWFNHFPRLRWARAGGERTVAEVARECRVLFRKPA
ncbi:MAG: tRNA (adenosine(37)-N6)-dimethylallyltransferase MiaA [Candidatus Brocadiaceae bacterium]|jgi:tRNA dimethylallyltransferase